MHFTGEYFARDVGVVRHPGLFEEAESGVAVRSSLGGGPINQQICPTAFALPSNGRDAGSPPATGGAGGPPTMGTGGTGSASGTGGPRGASTAGGGTRPGTAGRDVP